MVNYLVWRSYFIGVMKISRQVKSGIIATVDHESKDETVKLCTSSQIITKEALSSFSLFPTYFLFRNDIKFPFSVFVFFFSFMKLKTSLRHLFLQEAYMYVFAFVIFKLQQVRS